MAETEFAGEQLARFVVASRWDALPASLRHEGKRSLLNFIGCALGVARTPPIEMAMRVLKARLYQRALDERRAEEDKRVGEKKSIEWGSQIRSYVLHPYRMVKDHRTGHESGDTDRVLDGGLTPFVEAYLRSAAEGSRTRASS